MRSLADYTGAIHERLAAALEAGHRHIYLPDGTWLLGGRTLQLPGATDLQIECGPAAVLSCDAAITAVACTAPGRLRWVGGLVAGVSARGLAVAAGQVVELDRLRVTGAVAAGIAIDGTARATVRDCECSECGVAGAGSDLAVNKVGEGGGVVIIEGGRYTSAAVQSNVFVGDPIGGRVRNVEASGARVREDQRAGGYGIAVYRRASGGGRFSVDGCDVHDTEGPGLYLQADDLVVRGNVVARTASRFRDVTLLGGGITSSGQRVVIASNVVSTAGYLVLDADGTVIGRYCDGIVWQGRETLIAGNTVSAAARRAYRARGADEALLCGFEFNLADGSVASAHLG